MTEGRRAFLGQLLAGVGVATGATQPPVNRPGKTHNLVLVIVDAWRAEMMGCTGNRILKTPNFDALAARGVRFQNAFCLHGVCMPNRASIFTGRYPNAHGVWANGVTLRKSEVTLAQVLEEHGYATGSAGKHHFEAQRARGYPPRLTPGSSYYGFQEVHLAENVPGAEYLAFLKRSYPSLVDTFRKQPLPEEAHEIHWIVSQTLDFIDRKCKGNSPFFAYCSFAELSPPDTPPITFKDMYDPADMPMPKRKAGELEKKPPHYKTVYENQLARKRYPDDKRYRDLMAGYYAQTSFIDKQMGRIVEKLKSVGQLENTMVVLTTDHGLCLGDHWIWRHGPWLYDQVTNVPLVIYNPSTGGGRVVQELVESVDIMPTVLDCLGLPAPPGVQGKSLKPLIAGEAGATGEQTVWADDREAHELEASGVSSEGFHVMALRSKDWKYVHYKGQEFGELYDLRNDPDEFENLWSDASYMRLRNECRDRFVERLLAVRDPLPLSVADW